ncbi:MAG: hypothetical protein NTY07_13510 [Bacteroidia bacterium]|nr:hypothetical protein [Bacteroidia bacterium]
MKSIVSKLVLAVFTVIFSISVATAQKGELGKKLTDEQKALLVQQKQENTDMKKAFKATLTADQLAILQNAALTAKEKREAMKASLSADQKVLLKTNLEARKVERQAFMATLTAEQKANIKKMARKIGREGVKARMQKANNGSKG